MAKRTYEGVLLEKKLADLLTMIPSQSNFHVTAEQRTQLNDSIWIPMLKQFFVSDAKKMTEKGHADVLQNSKRQTIQKLPKDNTARASTDYQTYLFYLKIKETENKVKRGQRKVTEAMTVAKFVVGRMDEPEEVQILSPEAALKHEKNLLGAKHMLLLMPFMYGVTDTEADAAFWKSSVNQINSIFRGDYDNDGPQRQAATAESLRAG